MDIEDAMCCLSIMMSCDFCLPLHPLEVRSKYIFASCLWCCLRAHHGHSFQAIKLKLDMNDHLNGADVFSYPDIRISEKKIHPFFALDASFWKLGSSNLTWMIPWRLLMILTIRISGYLNIRIRIFWIFDPYTAISKARKLKLGMDDHLKGTNALGYPDIRISASASAVPCVVANLEMIINDLCIDVVP